ncbi:MAG: hypothetical protein M3Q07_27990, partial [Pseudobdellovibrionaceae bacterium]|nr:hypothetical protein [Pseudobdellovibrionaceae bacterium]
MNFLLRLSVSFTFFYGTADAGPIRPSVPLSATNLADSRGQFIISTRDISKVQQFVQNIEKLPRARLVDELRPHTVLWRNEAFPKLRGLAVELNT